MTFRFRNFKIYSEVRLFVKEMYDISKSFPKTERFGLSSQLIRASSSVLLNIAEGSMKKSDAEFSRFLLISIGSLSEVVAILDICLDQKYITPSIHKHYLIKCESLARKLYGFQRSLKS